MKQENDNYTLSYYYFEFNYKGPEVPSEAKGVLRDYTHFLNPNLNKYIEAKDRNEISELYASREGQVIIAYKSGKITYSYMADDGYTCKEEILKVIGEFSMEL